MRNNYEAYAIIMDCLQFSFACAFPQSFFFFNKAYYILKVKTKYNVNQFLFQTFFQLFKKNKHDHGAERVLTSINIRQSRVDCSHRMNSIYVLNFY